MLEDLKKDATQRMQKCVSAFKDQLKKLRTGRAHTSLIEHIKVDYYGSEMPLNQVANIATEDARTLTISPWEKAMVSVIEKAIYKSDLGLTPNTRHHQGGKERSRERPGGGARRAPRGHDRAEGNAQGKTHCAG
jgi:ribosome recycling factor